MFELIEDIIKLGLIVAALYIALGLYVRRRWPTRAESYGRRRVMVLLMLTLGVSAIKVAEDAIGGDSGPLDRIILSFLHIHVPIGFTGFFQAITLTGSSKVLFPVTLAIGLILLLMRHRFEAILITLSVAGAAITVYLLKTAAGRARPALWETDWYWGSSFPSGHTLVATAFATSLALCVARLTPRTYRFVLPVVITWAGLVGLSRMVLGVHWPTDVMASWCLGTLWPLAVYSALRLRDGPR